MSSEGETEVGAGASVGRFVIVRRLGAGGMGTVYEARDPELGRSVALKVLRDPEHGDPMRLLREAQALAQVQHPNVVTVYELGLHDKQVFVAMELVDGESLDRYFPSGRERPSWRSVCDAFLQAARGLAAVHGKGLIHRDVKPANLLVDRVGRVRVGDFGLARANATDSPVAEQRRAELATAMTLSDTAGTGDAAAAAGSDDKETVNAAPNGAGKDDTLLPTIRSNHGTPGSSGGILASPLTQAGAFIGTPNFMAPEQLVGRRATTASDQFSFCVAMWIALFDEHPFWGSGIELIDSIIDGRRRDTATGNAPRWLIRMLDRGLSAAPAMRYPSINAIVDTLERGMSRRRTIIVAFAIALASVVLLAGWRVVAESSRADREAEEARIRNDESVLTRATNALATDPTASLVELRALSPGSIRWREARMIAADAASRGVAHVFEAGTRSQTLAFARDGTTVVSAGQDRIRLWDLATWTERVLPTSVAPGVLAATFTSDGGVLSIDQFGHIDRRDARTGEVRRVRDLGGELTLAAFSPDATRIVVTEAGTRSRLVELAPGARNWPEVTFRGYVYAWSRDGSALAYYDRIDGTIGRVDMNAVIVVARPRTAVLAVAVEGDRVWYGDWEGKLADAHDPRDTPGVAVHRNPIRSLAFLADGSLVSSGGYTESPTEDREVRVADRTVGITDAASLRTLYLRGHHDEVETSAISPDGTLIVSSDRLGEIRVWKLPRPKMIDGDGHTITTAAALTPDRRELVIAKRNPRLEIRDLATGRVRRLGLDAIPATDSMRLVVINGRQVAEKFEGPNDYVTDLVMSPQRRRAITLDSGNRVVVWDLDATYGRPLADHVVKMAACADGTRVVTVHDDEDVRWWNVDTAQWTSIANGTPTAIACSPDGSRVVAAAPGGRIHIVDTATRHIYLLDAAPDAEEQIRSFAFSSDGTILAAGGDRQQVHVWDLTSNVERKLPQFDGTVTRLAWSPNDDKLATAAGDGTVHVWTFRDPLLHIASRLDELVLRGHAPRIAETELSVRDRKLMLPADPRGPLASLQFRSDGAALVTTAEDSTLRLWDLVTGTSRALQGPDLFATFIGDGPLATPAIAAVDHFDRFSIIADDLPVDESALRAWLGEATN